MAERSDRRNAWVEASPARPCPVCDKPEWCRIRSDGRLVACRRQESGCYKSKTDKNGGPVYLHRVGEEPLPNTAPPKAPGPRTKRADPDVLHQVYAALLAALPLRDAHRENLRQRGL